MMKSTASPSTSLLLGKYEPLAPGSGWPEDGRFDAIVLGSGVTNSLLCALLSTRNKMHILHIDRSRFIGGPSASIDLKCLFRTFRNRDPTEREIDVLGRSGEFSVDLVPKALLARGDMARILVHIGAIRYLDFCRVGDTYVYKGSKKKLYAVPATAKDAIASGVMGFFQKRRFRSFLEFVAKGEDADCKENATMEDVFTRFGLGKTERDIAGHVLGLQRDDAYLSRSARETLRNIRTYVASLRDIGGSPFLYPEYGIGGIAEACTRLCTIHGGIYLLGEDVDEILYDEGGRAIGIRSGTKCALGKIIVAEPSYVPKRYVRHCGKVVRSICILDHPIAGTDAGSCQIVIPQQQIALAGYPRRHHDIFISCVSYTHRVAPTRRWIVILSTVVETSEPLRELKLGFDLLGTILERFDTVDDLRESNRSSEKSSLYVSRDFDATTNFESVASDVLSLYERITGSPLDMTIGVDIEKK